MTAASQARPTVLFVDDDEVFLRSVARAMRREGYGVVTAATAEDGLKELQRDDVSIDVVVSDDQMPGMAGAEFLALVRDRHPATVRIMLTGLPSLSSAVKAINSGEVFRFLEKPCSTDMLALTVELAVKVRKLQRAAYDLLRQHQAAGEVRCDADGAILVDESDLDLDSLTEAIRKELAR